MHGPQIRLHPGRVLLLAALVASLPPAAAQSYTVVNLPNLNATYPSATAYDVNNSGQVTGSSQYDSSSSHVHAFSYASGTMTDLGVLNGTVSRGYAINDSGQVVGQSYNKAVVNVGGTWVDITTLDPSYSSSGQANAINSSGQVVGIDSNGAMASAFLYSGGLSGTVTSLGTLYGSFYSQANGINDAGVVVGYSYISSVDSTTHAFRYTGATMTDLGVFGSDTNSNARAINTAGLIVGDSGDGSSVSHAVFFDGTWHDLGTLGGTSSYAYGVNAAGTIVGSSVENTFYQTHAFVYSGSMVDLNSLVDLSGSGLLYLQTARSINDAGWIAGEAVTTSYKTAAYLLIPTAIPEPAACAACVGLLALAGAMWRRRSAL
ncbi:MAG TPA: hypothetical protein VHD61_14610 [Lacunisphaera sp.]|nr:hypothetical protein [Lacunisphaera sp.]